MIKIITYGTFDLFHYGHLRLLERARELGDYLVVAIQPHSSPQAPKRCVCSFEERVRVVQSMLCVNEVIAEKIWGSSPEAIKQKEQDILIHQINILAIGDDWEGKFDDLQQFCDVKYLKRTPGISTTIIRAKSRED